MTPEQQQEYATRLYQVRRELEMLKKEEASLTGLMRENAQPGDSWAASNGVKFVLGITKTLKYKEDAILFLRDNYPTALDVCASISTTKLTEAEKLGLIDSMGIALLKGMGEPKEIPTVRAVYPNEEIF